MKNKKNKKKRQALRNQQNDLCALCNQPLPDEGSVYDELHNTLICRQCSMLVHTTRDQADRNITVETFVKHEERERTDPERRNKPMYKTRRQRLLDGQDHRCVMCNESMSGSRSSCYDRQHNVFVCCRCSIFINTWRNAPDRGVTFETLATYEARERADDPQY